MDVRNHECPRVYVSFDRAEPSCTRYAVLEAFPRSPTWLGTNPTICLRDTQRSRSLKQSPTTKGKTDTSPFTRAETATGALTHTVASLLLMSKHSQVVSVILCSHNVTLAPLCDCSGYDKSKIGTIGKVYLAHNLELNNSLAFESPPQVK